MRTDLRILTTSSSESSLSLPFLNTLARWLLRYFKQGQNDFMDSLPKAQADMCLPIGARSATIPSSIFVNLA